MIFTHSFFVNVNSVRWMNFLSLTVRTFWKCFSWNERSTSFWTDFRNWGGFRRLFFQNFLKTGSNSFFFSSGRLLSAAARLRLLLSTSLEYAPLTGRLLINEKDSLAAIRLNGLSRYCKTASQSRPTSYLPFATTKVRLLLIFCSPNFSCLWANPAMFNGCWLKPIYFSIAAVVVRIMRRCEGYSPSSLL